jgi:hypothetical protein
MTNQNLHNEKLAEKVQFLMSMAGKDVDSALTALSYALVDMAIDNDIDLVSVIHNMTCMYMARIIEEENDVDN